MLASDALARAGRGGILEADPRWYETFFDRDWLAVAVGQDEERNREEVAFAVEKLGVESGARVLDLACGHGRHAVELAARGFRVTGLDISGPSLSIARERAAERLAEIELVQLDMRELAAELEYDAVLNLNSAFGYFPSEEEDQQVLERVARALVRGGRLLIDTINGLWIAGNFQARGWRALEDGTVMTEDRTYEAITGRSSAVWTLIHADGTRSELVHSMRVYTCPELCGMLTRAGLEPDGVWGGVDGSEYGLDTRRLIVRARKP